MSGRLVAFLLLGLLAGACGGNSQPAASEAEGVVDTAFGSDGVVVLARGALQRGAVSDVVQLDDGSFIIGGKNAYVAKLTPGGRLDASFGNGGIDDARRGSDSIQDVARLVLVANNRVAVVEVHQTPCPHPVFCGTDYPNVFARRIDANGTMDTGYGMNGAGRLQYAAGSIVVSPDGRVTSFAIQRFPVGSRFVVGSLDASGGNDSPFAARAQASVESCAARGTEYMSLQMVKAVAARDRIVVATRWYPLADLCVVRLNADGSLDATFADAGRLVVPDNPGGPNPWGFQVVSDDDRTMLLLSDGLSGPAARMLFLSARGAVEKLQEAAAVAPLAVDVATQKNGKIVTAGFPASASGLGADLNNPRLWRSSSTASVYDTGFGPGGDTMLRAGAVSVAPQKVFVARDGTLLVGGSAIGSGDGALIRVR